MIYKSDLFCFVFTAESDRRPQLTTEDSVQFVLTLKSELAGERGKYDEFIAIMR